MKTRTAFIAITATAAVSGLVGIGAGGSTVEPEVRTVTKTVEVPSEPEVVTETEYVTETVEVTSSACIDALDLADMVSDDLAQTVLDVIDGTNYAMTLDEFNELDALQEEAARQCRDKRARTI